MTENLANLSRLTLSCAIGDTGNVSLVALLERNEWTSADLLIVLLTVWK